MRFTLVSSRFLVTLAVLAMGCASSFAQAPLDAAFNLQHPDAVIASDGSPSDYAGQVNFAPAGCDACNAAPTDCGCDACKAKKKKGNPCAKSHKPLFYNNKFDYLYDEKYDGCCFGDNLKLMPVGECGQYGTLDVGGQLRFRFQHERGMGQEAGATRFQGTDNDMFLTRMRLYSNWKVNENVRFYVEGIYADNAASNDYIHRGIDRNYGDLLNAFVDVQLSDSLGVRVGRQELLYGNQRLVSPLDWANTRRTFEGIKLMWQQDDLAIDAFYTNFVPPNANKFDEADYDRSLYGIYATYKASKTKTYDFYYLGSDNQTAAAPVATDYSLHTFGGRVKASVDDWMYEFEGGAQFGRQSGLGLDHEAAFVTFGLGRKLAGYSWNPTVWFFYDYASGNNTGGDFNRFNQLYPLAHKYFGFIDAVQRSNIESPNLLVTMKPKKDLTLLFWYWHFMANTRHRYRPWEWWYTGTECCLERLRRRA